MSYKGYRIAEFIDYEDDVVDTISQIDRELDRDKFDALVQNELEDYVRNLGDGESIRVVVYEVISDDSCTREVVINRRDNLNTVEAQSSVSKNLDV